MFHRHAPGEVRSLEGATIVEGNIGVAIVVNCFMCMYRHEGHSIIHTRNKLSQLFPGVGAGRQAGSSSTIFRSLCVGISCGIAMFLVSHCLHTFDAVHFGDQMVRVRR